MGHRGAGLVEGCKIPFLPLRSRYIRRRLDAILLFSLLPGATHRSQILHRFLSFPFPLIMNFSIFSPARSQSVQEWEDSLSARLVFLPPPPPPPYFFFRFQFHDISHPGCKFVDLNTFRGMPYILDRNCSWCSYLSGILRDMVYSCRARIASMFSVSELDCLTCRYYFRSYLFHDRLNACAVYFVMDIPPPPPWRITSL